MATTNLNIRTDKDIKEQGPVYVTKNGYGRLVVMDIEYYERTMQKMYEAKAVIEGLKDL